MPAQAPYLTVIVAEPFAEVSGVQYIGGDTVQPGFAFDIFTNGDVSAVIFAEELAIYFAGAAPYEVVRSTTTYNLTTRSVVVLVQPAVSGNMTINLPASPRDGQDVYFVYGKSDADIGTNVTTIAGNGHNINGQSSQDMNTPWDNLHVKYMVNGATKGWYIL